MPCPFRLKTGEQPIYKKYSEQPASTAYLGEHVAVATLAALLNGTGCPHRARGLLGYAAEWLHLQ